MFFLMKYIILVRDNHISKVINHYAEWVGIIPIWTYCSAGRLF